MLNHYLKSSNRISVIFFSLGLFFTAVPAKAEVQKLRIAQQYGLLFLPLIIMQEEKMMEKHIAAAKLGDVKIEWSKFAGGSVMNDALLSGSVDFASGGMPPFIRLWSKTRGSNMEVKGVAAMDSMPITLLTRNPNVKTIKDFKGGDKIAMPAAKVSIQAFMLQMAAKEQLGKSNYDKIDHLTVTMAHPEAMASLLSGGEINSHFASPPYNYQLAKMPGIYKVLDSYDILGAATCEVVWATSKFRRENPKTYAAFLAAFQESIDLINKDKKKAAGIYLKTVKGKETLAGTLEILNDPHVEYTTTPKNTGKYTNFMHEVGIIKDKPASWKDLFFPEVHQLSGS
jgi:NitT/TauT family transport system substrate-binding protein